MVVKPDSFLKDCNCPLTNASKSIIFWLDAITATSSPASFFSFSFFFFEMISRAQSENFFHRSFIFFFKS